MHRNIGDSFRAGLRSVPFRAIAGLALALITGCAGTGVGRPPTETPSPQSSTPAASSGSDLPVTVIFRFAVAIDGTPHAFSEGSIHLVRTDLMPSWPLRRPAAHWLWTGPTEGDPKVRSLGPDAEDWYVVVLPPGRYHLNAVSKWHFPTVRAVPSLVLELPPGDRVAYAGSITVNCRDRLSPDKPASYRYDCEPPTIRTDEAGMAGRLSGVATGAPAIRAARPLSALTAPDLATRAGALTLEAERDETADVPLGPFPALKEAGARAAVTGGGGLLAAAATCGPLFVFCVAILAPVVIIPATVDGGIQHHGNRVRLDCSERIDRELREFDAEGRLRLALRERFAAAGRPLLEPASAPDAPAPAILLRVGVLRIGVRGDFCLPGINPLKLPDRYRADILASVRAVDGVTGAVLYEELLSNTDKLSPWEVIAGRGGLSPVGSPAACRRAKEFCPEEDAEVLNRDLEPAIAAFADHVVHVLTGAAQPSVPSP